MCLDNPMPYTLIQIYFFQNCSSVKYIKLIDKLYKLSPNKCASKCCCCLVYNAVRRRRTATDIQLTWNSTWFGRDLTCVAISIAVLKDLKAQMNVVQVNIAQIRKFKFIIMIFAVVSNRTVYVELGILFTPIQIFRMTSSVFSGFIDFYYIARVPLTMNHDNV